MQSFEGVVHCVILMTWPVTDVAQYAKLWVWKVTWELCCGMPRCERVIWSSEYGVACHAMGVKHDLEAMLWFVMLWAQGMAK